MKPPAKPAPPPITPEQMRDARGLLGWSRNRLAVQSETTVGFIDGYEVKGQIRTLLWHPQDFDALNAIRTAFEAAGVEFTKGDTPGVQLRKADER